LLIQSIAENYGLNVKSLTLIDSHFGTEIYLLKSDGGDFIVKSLPMYADGIFAEGDVTEHLHNSGINVARLLKTADGKYAVRTDELQYHVQDFIHGETLAVNTAPDWFMEHEADALGRIHKSLKSYGGMKISFGADFFTRTEACGALDYYAGLLSGEEDDGTISELEERIRHLKRIADISIDAGRMTYAKSHGDYHIGQIIAHDNALTVIDWTSACILPSSLEIMTSYVSSDPACKDGIIDSDRLKRYIDIYAKHADISAYDLEIMPFVLYFQQIMCHYTPPYSAVAAAYKPMCRLINSFTSWLYENAESLSRELVK
jgi:Predicted aminoglycoside phosphotransferase